MKKELSSMYPSLFTRYFETTGEKMDDKTAKRIRLLLNSRYGQHKEKNIMNKAHKWPEEKPEKDGEYLVRLDTGDEVVYKVLYIVDQYTPWTNYVTHWWNLPEVME